MKKLIIVPIVAVLAGLTCVPAQASNEFLEFFGSQYVSVPDDNSLDLSSAMTIEFWVYFSADTGDYQEVLCKSNDDGDENFRIAFSPGQNTIYFDYGNGSEYTATTAFTINLHTWYHVAFTVTAGSTGAIYVNGVESPSYSYQVAAPDPIPTNTHALEIGGCNFTERYLRGRIDELRFWNDIRTENEIRLNMYRELPTPSDASLAAYYSFNNSLNDGSSNTNNGTFYGGSATYGTSSAMFGPKNCLDFDGTDDWVDCGIDQSLLGTDFTVSAWIYPESGSNYRGVGGAHFDDGTKRGIVFCQYENGSWGFGFGSGDVWEGTAVSFDLNAWNFVTLVVSSENYIKVYVDGRLTAEDDSVGDFVPYTEFWIGRSFIDSNRYFDGRIDEFRIWNTALSATQIRQNMCRTLTGNESGLVACYTFDNTSGTTLQDGSGTLNDGSLNNMDGSTDWVSSSAFNTWLNTSSSAWSTTTNWSRGTKPGLESVGIYGYTGGSAPAFTSGDEAGGDNMVVDLSSAWPIGGSLYVSGNLVLVSDLDLNGQSIGLGPGGHLVEDTGRLHGATGTISATRSLNAPSSENVAGLGALLTSASDLGSTVVTRGHSAVSGEADLQKSIYRYYEITPTNNSGLDATLRFSYHAAELNAIPESDLALYRYDSAGEEWDCNAANQSRDTENDWVQQTGIDAFSRWTLGDADDPTAVALTSFSASGLGDGVRLEWETASEIDVAGFHILRRQGPDGAFERITQSLIPALGGTTWGSTYAHDDPDAAPGRTYSYMLQDVEHQGVTDLYGPVSAWAGVADVKVNGSDDAAAVSAGALVRLDVALQAGEMAGALMEYWVAARTPFGWYSHSRRWRPGIHPAGAFPLEDLGPLTILDRPLPPGSYTFFIAADDQVNGAPEQTWVDRVTIVVE